jgi:hypothetical protein
MIPAMRMRKSCSCCARAEHRVPAKSKRAHRCPLLDGQLHRLDIVLKEDARHAPPVLRLPRHVSHAVLVRMQRPPRRIAVGSRDDGDEVLEDVEVLVGNLDRVVEWLRDAREVGAKREFVDDVAEVHHCGQDSGTACQIWRQAHTRGPYAPSSCSHGPESSVHTINRAWLRCG